MKMGLELEADQNVSTIWLNDIWTINITVVYDTSHLNPWSIISFTGLKF